MTGEYKGTDPLAIMKLSFGKGSALQIQNKLFNAKGGNGE